MKITEIFYSIQGEGVFTGVPSVFVRVFGCNLNCQYCDSKYSIIKNKKNRYMNLYPNQIISRIKKFSNNHHVVITGGEPMLYKKELKELVNDLKKENYFVTIETNGTIWDSSIQPDLWSVSPKTSNSFILKDPCIEKIELIKRKVLHDKNNTYDHLEKFQKNGNVCQYKFVISDKNDLSEINHIVKQYNLDKESIQLMPEGITIDKQRERSLEIVEICKQTGYTFCPRLHIYLWGSKRGV